MQWERLTQEWERTKQAWERTSQAWERSTQAWKERERELLQKVADAEAERDDAVANLRESYAQGAAFGITRAMEQNLYAQLIDPIHREAIAREHGLDVHGNVANAALVVRLAQNAPPAPRPNFTEGGYHTEGMTEEDHHAVAASVPLPQDKNEDLIDYSYEHL